MTKLNFIKTIRLYAIELSSASGFLKQYPHPFLPPLYIVPTLSLKRGGAIVRGV